MRVEGSVVDEFPPTHDVECSNVDVDAGGGWKSIVCGHRARLINMAVWAAADVCAFKFNGYRLLLMLLRSSQKTKVPRNLNFEDIVVTSGLNISSEHHSMYFLVKNDASCLRAASYAAFDALNIDLSSFRDMKSYLLYDQKQITPSLSPNHSETTEKNRRAQKLFLKLLF